MNQHTHSHGLITVICSINVAENHGTSWNSTCNPHAFYYLNL